MSQDAACTPTDIATLSAFLRQDPSPRRRLVGVAGPPGSGKSTFSAALCKDLNRAWPGTCNVVQMDGFHYDDVVLAERGLRDKRGAPTTFDVAGFIALLCRLRSDECRDIAIPVFDRSLELSRAGAAVIRPAARILIVEGNYLLLNDPEWMPVRPMLDLTVFLNVPEEVLKRRLLRRWEGFGLAKQEAERKVSENDLPNARLVIDKSVEANFNLKDV